MPYRGWAPIGVVLALLVVIGSVTHAYARPVSAAVHQVATPTGVAPSETPTLVPTPTPRPAGSPIRIGIQAGHWKSNELPEELARLRGSTGAFSDGYAEVELNLAIAKRVERLLTTRGYVVDLLPATLPANYDADVFVALHADGATSRKARGYKLATPWRTSRASQLLADALDGAYRSATGLPRDGGITVNMRGYYAFNYRRHTYAIARTTPAVILEMGFLTNAADRAVLYGRADAVAAGIANGIVEYLNVRDPNDGAALLAPEFPSLQAATANVAVRAAPRDDARVLLRLDAEQRIFAFQERDGWIEAMVRGENRVIGWIRRSDLAVSNGPPAPPPPSTDS